MILRASPRVAIIAVVAVALGTLLVPARAAGPDEIVVHLDMGLGDANGELVGLGWNTGDVGLVADLRPPTVRIDADLGRVSPAEDAYEIQFLLDRVAAVHDIGAEPLVILSYMPAWLAEPAYGRDPTRVPPSDLEQWEALVTRVVDDLAVAPSAARRFEVWNEPDLPIFFQDLPTAFIEMALATHRAVAAVEEARGIDLEVGGPAAFFADPVYIGAYVEAVTREGLPLDFVSWHHYGNTPFLGPDGAEDILPPYVLPLYPVIGQRNPVTSPSAYRHQVEAVRAQIAGLLVGRPGYDPAFVIDEWNLSAGGYDLRHDSHVGAAFVAATLMEMEAAELDGADFYRAVGTATPGDWGLVRPGGSRKPSFHVFDAWPQTAGERLEVTGARNLDGVYARATRAGNQIHLLVASFVASGGRDQGLNVSLDGECADPAAVVRGIDAQSPDFSTATSVGVADGAVELHVPAQSVRWLTVTCA